MHTTKSIGTYKVPYTSFSSQIEGIKAELLAAAERVIDGGRYILGPQLAKLEQKLAEYIGVEHVVGMSSGTCALHLLLKGLGVAKGDEVITVPNSFVATAAAIAVSGGVPVFVDVAEDMNIDPTLIESAVSPRTKGIVVVHLTGRPAKMSEVLKVAQKHHLFVVEDAAQAIGAKRNGKQVGTFGDAAAFSCHPLKNLFAFGDSGFVTTSYGELYKRMWMSRSHGMSSREICDFWAYNCRMDELHAAMLLVNLKQLPVWTERRRELAFRYNDALRPYVRVPEEAPGEYCVYQTYMIQTQRRDELEGYLLANGVEALTHYRVPLHLQPAAGELGYAETSLPVAERLCREILSLPLYPAMTEAQQDYVIGLIARFYES